MNETRKIDAGSTRGIAVLLAAFVVFALFLFAGGRKAEAAIASGTSGTCTWVIAYDGTMTISPTDGVSGELASTDRQPWAGYGDVKKIVVNPGVKTGTTCKYLFSDLVNCTRINLANLDTSQATDMSFMFYGSKVQNLDLSGFDTSNVTNMESMFEGCRNLRGLNVSGFDTSNVTSMTSMFKNCGINDFLDLSSFDTSAVTSMAAMFYQCGSMVGVDISSFDTSAVTNMNSMFYGCSKLQYSLLALSQSVFDLSGFDTSNVTNMENMFSGCERITEFDLSGFNTGNVTNMKSMFNGCYRIDELDLSSFDTSAVTDMSGMFGGCHTLTSLDVSGFDTGNVTNMEEMFTSCWNLTTLDISNFDTSSVTKMGRMFSNCNRLASLNLSGLDTSNVESMSDMFQNDKALTTLDVSSLDTGSVTRMDGMFFGCEGLLSLNLSNFDTSQVTSLDSLFYGCKSLSALDLSSFDTSNVIHMSMVFQGCNALASLDVSSFDTGSVTSMEQMFNYCSSLTTLDVTNFDTSSVTQMDGMFQGCSSLTTLDVTNFDTSHVNDLDRMFADCSSLTSMDLTEFDTSAATTLQNVFSDCANLAEITLDEDFNFKGNSIADPAKQLVFWTPPEETTGGKWVREDESFGPFTPEELRDNYEPVMSGKWVWATRDETGIIIFDANGGYTDTPRVEQDYPFTPIAIPSAARPKYFLTGWNTERDGSGTSYATGDEVTPEGGKVSTFYAQWMRGLMYTVNHYKQNVDQTGYDLAETEKFYAFPNDTVTPATKEYEGFKAPATETRTIVEDGTVTIDYYYDRTEFTVAFDGNGADAGTMPDQSFVGGITQKLFDCKFKRDGHAFAGWTENADGTGTGYGDAQAVKDLANDGETKTLYAKWLYVGDSHVEATNGVIRFSMKAGQTATIPDLPAGTSYVVREVDVPVGWSQSGATNDQGTIGSNQTSAATVTNGYQAVGSVALVAHKQMEVGDMAPGQFTFRLMKDQYVTLQTATNGALDTEEEILAPDGETTVPNPFYGMSVVRFNNITFTEPGDYEYQIVEAKGGDASVSYDEHVETVVVHVSDNHDGTLTCVPEYDADGALFTNSKIPVFEANKKSGRLLIDKSLVGGLGAGTFDFGLVLTDAGGTPIAREHDVDVVKTVDADSYFTVKPKTVAAVSRTENVDELGNATSDYGDNWDNSNIRGTGREEASTQAHVIKIPGAESLHVAITYGGQGSNYDWVCAWQGEHPDYNPWSYRSAFTGRLGGGDHTSTSNTKEYDIPGDSVTFAFYSGYSGCGDDGYGYYAVVTAEVGEKEYNDKLIRTVKAASGSTIQLEAGQTAVVNDLPAGTRYAVAEGEKQGFELVSSDGAEGTIAEGADSTASFSNLYSLRSNPSTTLQATKTYEGGDLATESFTFELRGPDGDVVSTATTDEHGVATFPPIDYTLEDCGKTFRYQITEIDDGRTGVQYDQHVENVTVTVTDNGDGTAAATATYSNGGAFSNVKELGVTISKTDGAGAAIGGARLRVTGRAAGASSDIEPIEWTSVAGESHKLTLNEGSYVLSEIQPPTGYLAASDVAFTIESDGTVKVGGTAVDEVTMVDAYEPHDVVVSKKDVNGDEIAGAQLKITGRETGAAADIAPITWVSQAGVNKTVSLKPGSYVLHEEATPDSDVYVLASDVAFTVEVDGTVKVADNSVSQVDMLNVYKPHDVVISKKDVNGDEIAGAQLKITGRETGAEADIAPITWVSQAGVNKTVSLKPGTYVLHEEAVPDSDVYVLASDITFTVETDGTVKVAGTTVPRVDMLNVYKPHDVVVSKKDVNGDEIAGAQLKITGRETGASADIAPITWQSQAGVNKTVSLKPGSYVLHEEATPDSDVYVLASDVAFTVEADGTVKVAGTAVAQVEMLNVYKPHDVVISKKDVNGDEIAGAQLKITGRETGASADIAPITWQSQAGVNKTVSLKPGTYVLHEEAVPDGDVYVLASDITFVVETDGTVKVAGTAVAQVEMFDVYKPHDVTISKVDVNGHEIGGAQLRITGRETGADADITPIAWESVEGQDKTVSLKPGSYVLHEDAVPDSDVYVLASNIAFTVDANGAVKVNGADVDKVTMVDRYKTGEVLVSKTDINGSEIGGAQLKITGRETGASADIEPIAWTSVAGESKAVALRPGSYVLHEEATPDADVYVLASDIAFTVAANGTVKVNEEDVDKVTMVDVYAPHDVVVSKKDINGDEIAGAQLKITGRETGASADIAPITWESQAGVNKTVSLKPGSYVLHEEATPDSDVYVLASDVAFTVEADGTVKVAGSAVAQVEMLNVYAPHDVVISKKDVNGDEIAGAQLKITGRETGALADITPIAWESEAGVNKTVSLKPGTYVLHEEAVPDGDVYVLASDITFVVETDGTVKVAGDAVSQIDMFDVYKPHDVVVSKKDINGDEIAGAQLKITGRETGAAADITPIAWESEAGVNKTVSLKPGAYVLHEEATPDSDVYVLASDIAFTVETDGTVKVNGNPVSQIDMLNVYKPHDVVISKKDVNGDEIAGAQLKITGRETGASADIAPITWQSQAGVNKTVSLKPGTYVLHEEAVPDGDVYVLASDITFVVETDGTVKVAGSAVSQVDMLNVYKPHAVTIRKTDSEGALIGDAKLRVTGRETGAAADIAPITWTSVEGQTKSLSLKPGAYVLHEDEAPEGYAPAQDMAFTVEPDGAVKVGGTTAAAVTMVDERGSAAITVTKTVEGSLGDRAKKFRFVVTLTKGTTDLPAEVTVTVDGGEAETVEVEGGKFEFAIAHGETATIEGVPIGTTYSIDEPDAAAEGYSVAKTGESGVLTKDGAAATFTNSRSSAIPTAYDTGSRRTIAIALADLAVLAFALFAAAERRKKRPCV